DKGGEMHYDVISAFIKSVRGSDPDAAVYYMARMLEGGEDPVFIARRLIILASEDVGNADPRALSLAVAGLQAVEAIGLPEAAITLSQVTTYMASCPKSNRSYMALNQAKEVVQETKTIPVPLHLRSSKTPMSKDLGYGKGYKYPHSFENAWVEQSYLPTEIQDKVFYEPSTRGFEKNLKDYLQWVKSKPAKT
ncbi:MAG: replication-associated recombination protein A, partial [Proteobacteria bacterium]